MWLEDLLGNNVLTTTALAWLLAGIAKVIIVLLTTKKFDASRIFGDGGMPSAHSAFVTSRATSVAMECGVGSVEFAISASLAFIVMHDAHSVRLEAGKHAKRINEILDMLNDEKINVEGKMKELLGHTPLQVLFGSLLGLTTALLRYLALGQTLVK